MLHYVCPTKFNQRGYYDNNHDNLFGSIPSQPSWPWPDLNICNIIMFSGSPFDGISESQADKSDE